MTDISSRVSSSKLMKAGVMVSVYVDTVSVGLSIPSKQGLINVIDISLLGVTVCSPKPP